MKKKQIILTTGLLIPFLAILIGSGILKSENKTNFRAEYETFLNSEYAKIQRIDPEVLKELPKPDRPDQAAIRNYFMTVDPELKAVPSYRLKKAYEEMKTIQQTANFKSGNNSVQWQERQANMGGRSRNIMFDPNDPNNGKAWAGSVSGGLFKINDAFDLHESWMPVNDFWENLAVSCMAYDPNNTQEFYVGTGESQTAVTIYRESGGRGSGILKSSDGGESWAFLPSTENFAYVSDIVIRDENGQSVIYAGVLSGHYWGEQISYPTDGLYRSSDGGESWEQVLPNIAGHEVPYAVSDIELTSDGSRIFIGTTYNIDGDGASCILYSDNGSDWTLYDDYRTIILGRNDLNIPGRVVLASAPSDPNNIIAGYVAGRPNMTGGFIGYWCPYIIRTTDKGDNWEQLNIPMNDPSWATIAWHALVLKIQPDNPDIIWAGGLVLWRSSDAGQTWQYTGSHAHVDQHAIEYRPGSTDDMLFANDGGVYYSQNGTADNPEIFDRNQNFNTLQYYSCAIHPAAGQEYYLGGLQDNGTMIYRGDRPVTDNDRILGGDGAYCFVDEIDGEAFVIASSQYNNLTFFSGPSNRRPNPVGFGSYGLGDFINPADWDSRNTTYIANGAMTWGVLMDTLLSVVFDNQDAVARVVYVNSGSTTLFSNVKVSPYTPQDSTTVFLGSQSGRLFKVENAQISPVTTEIGSPDFPAGYISGIDIGSSEDEIIITFSNYGVESVWLTDDGGTNWKSIEGNLPDMPVRWVLFHPQNSRQALIATEIGIWEASDLNMETVEWKPVNEGLANVRVDMIKVRTSDNMVVVASHGRGLFTGQWNISDYTGINKNILSEMIITAYPNPVEDILKLSFTVEGVKDIDVAISDINGRCIISDRFKNITGNYTNEFDMSSYSSGIYFVRISNAYNSQSKKIVLK